MYVVSLRATTKNITLLKVSKNHENNVNATLENIHLIKKESNNGRREE